MKCNQKANLLKINGSDGVLKSAAPVLFCAAVVVLASFLMIYEFYLYFKTVKRSRGTLVNHLKSKSAPTRCEADNGDEHVQVG